MNILSETRKAKQECFNVFFLVNFLKTKSKSLWYSNISYQGELCIFDIK